MRFAILVLLSAVCGASAEAIESLLRRGSTSQVCACISGDLRLDSFYGGRKVTAGTLEESCICESDVTTFVTSSSACKNGIGMVGRAIIEIIIAEMITSCSNKKTCTFPDHSTPACTSSNKCGFSCGDGYSLVTKNGQSTCTCASPKSVCNGKCSSTCPSARSLPEKRNHLHWGQQTQRVCRPGWVACGIAGGGLRQWECIDIKSDLESCGGCPMDVISSDGSPGHGVDCTTISGVSDVSCVSGHCAVEKCMPGYTLSGNGRHCDLEENISTTQRIHYPDDTHKGTLSEKIVAAAAAFGLEHLSFSE
ncbi:hypothetical protein GGU11DRAFT_703197 [Lentinula aff. detonsa]|uniref:Protein CPL1-like domain-containing protein n=1 Tax=Lentinula aff. detonsa TaxID=2804958 RepID=A0AA38KQM8_9AGAR|nr:hypothetical protein GGU10DRAFT_375498 [Lentinula aff. detonsa]KAJ3798866.1 hypothetical protein GGU11DRAFT_703197 [Lentinula aff. detonsa]